MFLASVLVAALATAPTDLCKPPLDYGTLQTCADAELTAWARAVRKVEQDLRAAHRYALSDVREHENWPDVLSACRARECRVDAYRTYLQAMAVLYDSDGVPLRIRGGQNFRTLPFPRAWNYLVLYDLGDGWSLFWLDGGYSSGPRELASDITGRAAGVVRLKGGKASYRVDTSTGFDFARSARGWTITQVGECDCGHLVGLGGVYKPTHKSFPLP